MNERFRVYLAYFLVCSIWGSTWLVIKIGLETMPPLLSAGCRFLVASAILFALITIRGVKVPLNRSDRLFYVGVALTAFSVPYGLVYWGEQYIPSGLTSIVFSIYPFTVALFSFLFLSNEKMTLWKISGIAIGFFGIFTIYSNDIHVSGPNASWGMAAVLASAVLQAYSVIFIKKHGQAIHPFAITFVPMLLGAVLLLAGSAFLEDFSTVDFTPRAVLAIFYLGIFGSVATFVSYFWLLKRVEAVILSLTSFITPIIAVLLGVIVLGEQFSSRTFLGGAIVLCGIAVSNYAELAKYVKRNLISAE
ncbi:MAG: EamA family transporter [Bacteroidota bacterium]